MAIDESGARRVLFLLSSGRGDGNAELLARRAAASLPHDAEQVWLRHSDYPLPEYVDMRHTEALHQPMVENARILLEKTLWATDLVFVAPVYWYSVPASSKLYLDYWANWLREPGVDFRARMAGKTFWAITVLSERELHQAKPLLGTLQLCATYLKASWGGSMVGFGNRPGDVAAEAAALADADKLFSARTDLAGAFAEAAVTR
ncbi:multimeric flavodoxin WrbA [Rhodoligotrophos appendicifer]|uniref:NAD(P)H-dependent oxidoreductase n=1 Tax=Rhodoligotrophos appendicifer TaxID=987056 RepID=UPI00117D0D5C|nr:NAD(P)H-dependent oxidoreductase [Rhodoligotrophos appendicifer]